MNALARFLAPRPLTLLVFLGLLYFQWSWIQQYTVVQTDFEEIHDVTITLQAERAYGFGGPFVETETYEDGPYGRSSSSHAYRVHWGVLALNLALTYLVACAIAAFTYATQRWRRHVLVYSSLAGLAVAGSFITVITLIYLHFGYYFAPPGPMDEIRDIARVEAVVVYKIHPHTANGEPLVVTEAIIKKTADLKTRLPVRNHYQHEHLLQLFDQLDSYRLLPGTLSHILPGDIPSLNELLDTAGALPEGGPLPSEGVAVLARAGDGRRLLFLGTTGEFWEYYDRYQQHLFTAPPGSGDFRLTRSFQYQYYHYGPQIAWYYAWPILAGIALVVLCGGLAALTGLARILPRWWWREAKASRSAG